VDIAAGATDPNATAQAARADEFDVSAAWAARAIAELGREYALPAACRGSGSPGALRWLGEQMRLRSGQRLLDSGAGMGGPAQFAVDNFAVAPTLVEPMRHAALAAARLFGLATVNADGAHLPVRDHSFGSAWSLGVLCTSEDQPGLLAELRRVVSPGAPVGLLVFVRGEAPIDAGPEGDDFPTAERLHDLLEEAGLRVRSEADLNRFPAPPSWTARAEAVSALVRQQHGDDERWRVAARQQKLIGRLLRSGQVTGRLLVTE
jgi:SAM-dependent methyltransferase